jgi:hypothetical protein
MAEYKQLVTGIKRIYVPGSLTMEVSLGGVTTDFSIPSVPDVPPTSIAQNTEYKDTDTPRTVIVQSVPNISNFSGDYAVSHHTPPPSVGNYKCSLCGIIVSTPDALQKHYKQVHPEIYGF